jgi:hypothetical protein
MKIILFGGRHGTPISDYFKHLEMNLGAFINSLRHQKLPESEIRKKIMSSCMVEKINVDFNSRVLDIISEKEAIQPVDGFPSKVIVATYRQKVPFTGKREILERMPIDAGGSQIFHGVPQTVDIQGQYIITTFEARKDFQPQMDHFGNESLGRYDENQRLINAQIQKWNDALSVRKI